MSWWWLLLIVPAAYLLGRFSIVVRGEWSAGYVRGWKDRTAAMGLNLPQQETRS